MSDEITAFAERVDSFNKLIVHIEGEAPMAIASQSPIEPGGHYSLLEVVTLEPGQTKLWYVNGRPGATVQMTFSRQAQSGGHKHANDANGGPAGSALPPSHLLGPTYPQNQVFTIAAPEAGGLADFYTRFSTGENLPGVLSVLVPNLTEFTGGVGITLVGATDKHAENHYGLPQLNAAIAALGQKFHTKFKKNIFVNDMSLPKGGLFDISGAWQVPHATHRDGRRVDINSTSMTKPQQDFFRTAAKEAGFRSVVLETSPPHWHLEI